MPNNERPSLEAFVHRALRELPAERAPADLEARVFAALQARRQLPWWQADWREWPVVPRVAVFAVAAVVAAGVAWLFLAGARAVDSFDLSAWIELHAPGLVVVRSVVATVVEALALFVRTFQPWLLGLAVLVAGSYAALIALGSGLYRRLVNHR